MRACVFQSKRTPAVKITKQKKMVCNFFFATTEATCHSRGCLHTYITRSRCPPSPRSVTFAKRYPTVSRHSFSQARREEILSSRRLAFPRLHASFITHLNQGCCKGPYREGAAASTRLDGNSTDIYKKQKPKINTHIFHHRTR